MPLDVFRTIKKVMLNQEELSDESLHGVVYNYLSKFSLR